MSRLTQAQYQIVLTGELLPGGELESAISGMAKMFRTSPESLRELLDGTSHPIAQEFTAEQAQAVRKRLERIGVDSRLERRTNRSLSLKLEPGFADVSRAAAQSEYSDPVPLVARTIPKGAAAGSINKAATSGPKRPTARPAPDPNNPHWNRGWDDFEDDAPDEERHLALFIGPEAPRYVRVFDRFGNPQRPRFTLSWNWGAFLSPFLWTMYRKMWFWAFLIMLTEVLVPALILLLDQRGVLVDQMAPVAFLIAFLNRMFWPAVVDFLYFGHVHGSLARVHRMSPTSPHENEIASTGGVSTISSVVGAAVVSVIVLFSWSLFESMGIGASPFELGGYAREGNKTTPSEAVVTPLARSLTSTRRPTNKWGKTRTQLRSLAAQINTWLAKSKGSVDPTSLTLFKLRKQVGIPDDGLQDAWGADIQYIPAVEGFRLISSGPDQLFGTADDIQFKQVVGR